MGLACWLGPVSRTDVRLMPPSQSVREDLSKHMIKLNLRKTVMVGIAAGAAVGLVATAANAAVPTYKITAGSKTTGTTNYSGKATGTSSKPAIHFTDTTSGIATTCVSGTANGTMKLGAHVSGTAAGNITATKFITCKGPGGLTLNTTQPSTSKWTINGVARPVNGVTKVFIGNVTANVSTNIGCKFTVKGATDATYSNSTGKLSVAPRAGSGHVLKASNANASCLGLVSNGDTLVFKGAYTVSTPTGKLGIN